MRGVRVLDYSVFFTLDLFRLAVEILNARQIDAEVRKREWKIFIYHSSIVAAELSNSKYLIIPSCTQKEIKFGLLIADFKHTLKRYILV